MSGIVFWTTVSYRGELRYEPLSTYYGYLKPEAHKDPQPWPWPPNFCDAYSLPRPVSGEATPGTGPQCGRLRYRIPIHHGIFSTVPQAQYCMCNNIEHLTWDMVREPHADTDTAQPKTQKNGTKHPCQIFECTSLKDASLHFLVFIFINQPLALELCQFSYLVENAHVCCGSCRES